MAPQVTEILYITLKPGVELDDSSDSAQAWKDTISTLQRQDGFLGMNWGQTIESPNLLIGMIHWQTLEQHKKFESSPDYHPFLGRVGPIVEAIHIHHFIPTPSPPSILSLAPVIEFATFFKIQPEFPSALREFLNVCGPLATGSVGYSYGEAVEEISKHADVTEGKEGDSKGMAFVALLGWESVDAHMKFRETEAFKEHIGLIRGNHGGSEMFHVAFKTV